ncbi:MAG: NAD(P)H-hydrate dehydratase [Thermoguttaceae bacterium]
MAHHGGPRILTPHPGEFARLIGKKLDGGKPASGQPSSGRSGEGPGGDEAAQPVLSPRQQAAIELAERCGIVVVLKGHRTLVTDGRRYAINRTGNPGMATGGSGDVLTGVITALVCQQLELYAAAQLGVYVHGLAGDLAAEELGQVSMIASDLIRFLPRAFQQIAIVYDL